jgi:hypothetical protein
MKVVEEGNYEQKVSFEKLWHLHCKQIVALSTLPGAGYASTPLAL